ncbi:hypothetical protein TrCOL_g637 [Triparma columacea]|nr:hypothetical protein TrCOL_g637 [Triparma columacea]
MGGLDSVAGVMSTFSLNYIPNASLVVLLGQASIPISMIISKMFLKAKYTRSQYAGAGVVMMGIVVVLIPEFFGKKNGEEETTGQNQNFWIFIQIISIVPGVFSSVYKEKALGTVDIDVTYLNGWVALFQFLFALPLAIPSAYASNLTIPEIPQNMIDGARCALGQSFSFVSDSTSNLMYNDCSMAPFYVSSYLFFNLALNILIVLVLKHGSAAILAMSSTILVPLGNFAFSLDFMPGHKPQRPTDIAGLFVIMAGLMVFRYFEQVWDNCRSTRARLGGRSSVMSKQDEIAEKMATQRSAAFVGLSGPGTGIDRPMHESLRLNFIRAERRRINWLRSPAEIRGSLLMKLGVAPSPNFWTPKETLSTSSTPRDGGGGGKSPGLISERVLARMEAGGWGRGKGRKDKGKGGGGGRGKFKAGITRSNSLSPGMGGGKGGGDELYGNL